MFDRKSGRLLGYRICDHVSSDHLAEADGEDVIFCGFGSIQFRTCLIRLFIRHTVYVYDGLGGKGNEGKFERNSNLKDTLATGTRRPGVVTLM